jgi:hypothetical protein
MGDLWPEVHTHLDEQAAFLNHLDFNTRSASILYFVLLQCSGAYADGGWPINPNMMGQQVVKS